MPLNNVSIKNIGKVVFLVFLLVLSACMENPRELSLNDIIIFFESEAESGDELTYPDLPADGVSKQLIRVRLVGDTPDSRKVTFKTDSGRFATVDGTSSKENPKQLEVTAAGFLAEAYLISGTEVMENIITASVGGYTIPKSIYFSRVYPKRIWLNSTKTKVKPDGSDTATITIHLVPPDREDTGGNQGTVSEKTRLIIEAAEVGTGAEAPEFYREALSTANGTASVAMTSSRAVSIVLTIYVEDKPGISSTMLIEFAE